MAESPGLQRHNMRTFWPIVTGALTLIVFMGGLAGWSVFAPLDSAALAPGVVSVETHRKTIKHLEGGIVELILVQEGARVLRGQELVILDPTRAQADLGFLQARKLTLSATEARLRAEQLGREEIVFSDEFREKSDDTRLAEIFNGEITLLKERRQALESQIAILEQQNVQLSEQIKGLTDDISAKDRQLEIIKEQIDTQKSLYDKGLAAKPLLLALRREKAEIEGSISLNLSNIAQARQKMNEALLRISNLRIERQKEISEHIRAIQSEILELDSRIKQAEDVLERTVVTASQDGTVVDMKIHTPGGVVGPGDALMDIVPIDDRLVVDARVNPEDIDVVYTGLPAELHLTPFNNKYVHPLKGRVISVSADRLVEERSGEAYYLARIELTDDLSEILPDAALYPGMPAEVMILTGRRAAAEYLFEPIRRSFNGAFREQ
jgi:HlyD family type I secretion membrane fusion protein